MGTFYLQLILYIAIFQPVHGKGDMKKTGLILLTIFSAIILDQLSKGILLYLITGSVPLSGFAWDVVPVSYLMAHVCNMFNIVFTWNFGTSFSLFDTLGEAAPMVMVVGTGFVIGCILYYLFARAASYERFSLALIAGGALGNLIDRIRFGAVIDFLDFHIGGYHWPAFNIADMCIVIGVGLYLLKWYIARRRCIELTKDGK